VSSYTDREEIEKLQTWWKTYGGALLLGVLLGVALLFGNKYWTQYKEQQRVDASELYAQMLQQVQESKADAARSGGEKLIADYARTPYAGMAALLLARLSFEANDVPAARKRLEWAVANATDPAIAHAARLRLGRVHLAAGEYAAALALVQKNAAGFEAEYLELKGDAYLGLGKTDEARAAYGDAVKQSPAESASRRVLEMKLEDSGGAKS
jgi:predicted negative regulator of RcsB-dependent stress response